MRTKLAIPVASWNSALATGFVSGGLRGVGAEAVEGAHGTVAGDAVFFGCALPPALVFARALRGIDYEDFDRALAGFEFQAEVSEGGEDGGAVGGSGGGIVANVFEREIELA